MRGREGPGAAKETEETKRGAGREAMEGTYKYKGGDMEGTGAAVCAEEAGNLLAARAPSVRRMSMAPPTRPPPDEPRTLPAGNPKLSRCPGWKSSPLRRPPVAPSLRVPCLVLVRRVSTSTPSRLCAGAPEHSAI
ncbi:hypothetical protein K466DRAFT_333789 [Polyporus arcularius HHB13444]|uniref:Uncharacterized protein n=1 Tax=Polyporus arcularius HHB13444 TaxID=1314778 RepID=A0A5C3NYJ4_9APHY|nr:hypothetical protein K466DRAFT_333789 [Polyporus arcularius HHB13444]